MSLDRFSDLLTTIRNGQKSKKQFIIAPTSKFLNKVIQIFVDKGYVKSFELLEKDKKQLVKVYLKYTSQSEGVIREVKLISKRSCRVYAKANEVPRIKNGYATLIISTSKGVMTGDQARSLPEPVGGEILCYVF